MNHGIELESQERFPFNSFLLNIVTQGTPTRVRARLQERSRQDEDSYKNDVHSLIFLVKGEDKEIQFAVDEETTFVFCPKSPNDAPAKFRKYTKELSAVC